MRKLTMMWIMLGFIGTTTACMTDEEDVETGTAINASETCRLVEHFAYAYGGGDYRWNVTTENTGRQFVDEWRNGHYGATHVQYRVSPEWSRCARVSQEVVQLARSGVTLLGAHNCLADGRQEFHGSDYQRLLARTSPYFTLDCSM